MKPSPDAVRAIIRDHVIDPELGINVVDMGLIYDVRVDDDQILVDMTLTTPGCPLAASLPAQVEEVLRREFEGYDVEVSLVWEPRWTPDMMSEEVRRQFGAL
ncbi:MAG: metal-sulfur cluster assembly factor [Candidatus Acetothermia bacterium]|jgi:metal-sulfur cluster biosynthetic enzyme|nr:metal-sulfur cluster assembly factor [Candidatus Acetothermia bacterium]